MAEELATLEYSQRLAMRGRAIMAGARSTGRTLFDAVVGAGAQAAGRGEAGLRPGAWADLMALDTSAPDLEGLAGDARLDAWIFAGGTGVTDLWSAGRHIVREGRHIARDRVEARYRAAVAGLRNAL